MSALLAFEAAARHLSFTRAAGERNLTQSAVSRHIRALEEDLGQPLFHRTSRTVALTPAGRHYANAVRAALGQIEDATRSLIASGGGEQLVVVGTTASSAALWLLPRIARFRDHHPDLEVRVLVSPRPSEFTADEVDLSLYRLRDPLQKGQRSWPLLQEEIFPVCSPAFLARCGSLPTTSALLAHPLLDGDHDHPDWMSWEGWFEALGLPWRAPPRRIRVNNYLVLVKAAIGGQGFALGWRYLVDDEIASGALVRPVDAVLRGPGCFCLVEPKGARPNGCVDTFRDYLLAEVAPSLPVGV